MDNLTHTLTGMAISRAGIHRQTRFATAALILAANAPDVDLVTRFWGSATYLKDHRGLTHSILGVTLLAAVTAGLVYGIGRRARPKAGAPPLDGRWLALGCWIGTASHLLLDWTNAYGVRPFMPFNDRWYAADIMPIIDPALLLLLLAGLLLPGLFRMVSEEVGARKPVSRRGAFFALGAMLALWLVRGFAHARVLSLLEAHTYSDEAPLQAGAFPTLNPLAWTGVIETESAFHLLPASALAGDADLEHDEIFYKPAPSPALTAALGTSLGRVFSRFARFPWAQVTPAEDGFEVTIQDLRFASPHAAGRAFYIDIRLDRNLCAVSEEFHFAGPPAAGR